MKLLYTNENRLLVNHVKNLIEGSGIPVLLKNEYAVGGVGDLSPFDTWLELWLADDADYEKALQIIASSTETKDTRDWICNHCHEHNDASFDYCWNCKTEGPQDTTT